MGALAEVLGEHVIVSCHPDPGWTFRWTCGCGAFLKGDDREFSCHRDHVEAAILAHLAERLRSSEAHAATWRAICATEYPSPDMASQAERETFGTYAGAALAAVAGVLGAAQEARTADLSDEQGGGGGE